MSTKLFETLLAKLWLSLSKKDIQSMMHMLQSQEDLPKPIQCLRRWLIAEVAMLADHGTLFGVQHLLEEVAWTEFHDQSIQSSREQRPCKHYSRFTP